MLLYIDQAYMVVPNPISGSCSVNSLENIIDLFAKVCNFCFSDVATSSG